eukprot:14762902-Alexandrium_andersonii.AAC.1
MLVRGKATFLYGIAWGGVTPIPPACPTKSRRSRRAACRACGVAQSGAVTHMLPKLAATGTPA